MCILCTPRPVYRSILVDVSNDTRPMYQLTYRPILDRYVGRHIDQHSANISTEICGSTYRPIHWPSVSRYIKISVDVVPDTWPIRSPLIVGGISVDCWWCVGRKCCAIYYDYQLSKIRKSCCCHWQLAPFPVTTCWPLEKCQSQHSSLPKSQVIHP